MQQAVCVRRKKINEKNKQENIRPTANTRRNPQQPGDRDHLETACGETRPTVSPILVLLLSIDPGCVEISLACIHICVLAQLLCRLLYTFGAALFSRKSNLFFYCCDMYLRLRGCPVVLDIELSVSAWYQKKESTV